MWDLLFGVLRKMSPTQRQKPQEGEEAGHYGLDLFQRGDLEVQTIGKGCVAGMCESGQRDRQ